MFPQAFLYYWKIYFNYLRQGDTYILACRKKPVGPFIPRN